MASETITLELTEEQRNVVLSSLHDKLAETERYLIGAKVPSKPRPSDSCCEFHLARYTRDREIYVALKEREKVVAETLDLFNGEQGHSMNGTSS